MENFTDNAAWRLSINLSSDMFFTVNCNTTSHDQQKKAHRNELFRSFTIIYDRYTKSSKRKKIDEMHSIKTKCCNCIAVVSCRYYHGPTWIIGTNSPVTEECELFVDAATWWWVKVNIKSVEMEIFMVMVGSAPQNSKR